MSGVSFGGLASGLDTENIISQLITLERQPRVRMELRSIAAQARADALADIKSKLTTLQSAATALRSAATWGDVQSVESSDAAKVAVRQLAGAAPGASTIEVSQLARAAQKTFTYVPPVLATTMVVGGATVDLAAGATVDDAVSAINASSGAGVYAVNVGGQLVLSSKTTGAASTITAVGTTVVEDLPKAKAGLDAQYTVDGGPPRTSATNLVSDAIPGLELTLKAPTAGPVTITVGTPAPDTKAVEEKVKAFVDAYNATVDLVRSKLREERVAGAATAADVKKGVLFGDPALNGLLSQLRSTIGAAVGGNPSATDELADIGISTGAASGAGTFSKDAVAGKLVLDTAKLTAALTADPAGVQRLLGGTSGVDGFAQAFEGVLTPSTAAGGSLDGANSAAKSEVARLKEQMARLDDRLSRREDRLRAQFAALETALARSQAQQSSLMSQLGGLQ